MASIATDARPAIVAAFLLTLTVTPWGHGGPTRVIVPLDVVKQRPVIVAMELDAGPGLLGEVESWLLPAPSADIIEPADHPDAQAWPRGMVIRPPAFPDQMSITAPTVLDRLLSALLGHWHSVPS